MGIGSVRDIDSPEAKFSHDRIEFSRSNSHVNYPDISHLRLSYRPALAPITFGLLFWLVWLVLTYGFMFSTGGFKADYMKFVVKDLRVLGVIVALGILTMRLMYKALPKWLYLECHAGQRVFSARIARADESEKAEALKSFLKKKVGDKLISPQS